GRRPGCCRLSGRAACRVTVRPPPTCTLFPYTTLFRSWLRRPSRLTVGGWPPRTCTSPSWSGEDETPLSPTCPNAPSTLWSRRCRSEEHTSELQSRENLVCRLLLEKKKTSSGRWRRRTS